MTQAASQPPSASVFRDLTTQPGSVPNSRPYRRQTSLILICRLIKKVVWKSGRHVGVGVMNSGPDLASVSSSAKKSRLFRGRGLEVWDGWSLTSGEGAFPGLPPRSRPPSVSPSLDSRFVFFRTLMAARNSFTHSSVWAFILWEGIFPTGRST